MDIVGNINYIKSTLPAGVKLIAVSKTKPVEDIRQAFEGGQRVFGENKVQELAGKYEALPKEIEWHFIGHLQTNKVKMIVPFVSLIHSVDSLKLLQVIDREAEKCRRERVDCLLQFHIAEEETKFGLDEGEAEQLLSDASYASLKHVRITGVMGIATNTEDTGQRKKEFHHLKEIFLRLKQTYFSGADEFKEISMGMSEDYKEAIEEGSTMVRIGSSIFGERIYK